MNSWRDSTAKQYTPHILRWFKFASDRNIDPFQPSVAYVLDFLADYFQNTGYSALNTARSALSSFIFVNNLPVGKHALVVRFMKGAFNMKPSFPRYTVTWDVNIVLKFLKDMPSLDTISLKFLTYKLVMLIALVTGQRCQTIKCLDLDNYDTLEDKVFFRITNLLKQTRPGVHLSAVELKRYTTDVDLCVVRCFEVYIHRTASLRENITQLFTSYCKPYKAASSSTIARWIRSVLQLAGIDTDLFKAHSTRAASSSAAFTAGMPINDILKAVGWNSNCVFGKFYHKEIVSSTYLGDSFLH